MDRQYGIPIVTAETIDEVLEELGIRPWKQVRPPQDLHEYAASDLSDAARNELERFGPKGQAMFLKTPQGSPFTGFRSVGRNWATVFALIPNEDNEQDPLVPIVGEWKHGAEVITLNPPAGVPSKEDRQFGEPMARCGKREFEEETGIELKSITALSERGIAVSSRQTTQLFFPFLGVVKEPLETKPTKLDGTEDLKPLLISLSEWMKLIDAGLVSDASAYGVTFLALRRLGRLPLTVG